MARDFVPVDRDQLSLLPTDMGEWLEGDHFAWFVIDVVGRLDLSGLTARYQLDGPGRRAYDPAMLLTLLIYAYSQGERSSRRVERGCRTDAAYRVICGRGSLPDHSTLCRFRQRHQDDIADLFCQVVRLAQELGMARLGVLAIDGTKVAANASLAANRSGDWVRARVEEILGEADLVDKTEDTEVGETAADQVPAELADPGLRAERLQAALDALEPSRDDNDDNGGGDNDDGEGRPVRSGRKRRPRRVNLTDPDSRVMSEGDGGLVQGYNCQIAVTDDGMVVAARATSQENDYGLLSVMLGDARRGQSSGDETGCRVVLADAGYFDTADIAGIEAQPEVPLLLVATGKRGHSADPGPDPRVEYQQTVGQLDRVDQKLRMRRAGIVAQWEAGEIDYKQAAQLIGVHPLRVYHIRDRWRQGGVDNIPVPKRRRPPPPAESTVVRHQLETRLADPDNRRLYQQRSHQAETPFAQIKHRRRLTRFSRRGLAAVNAEFAFECLIHNLGRIRGALQPR